jgi:hypothetical protein
MFLIDPFYFVDVLANLTRGKHLDRPFSKEPKYRPLHIAKSLAHSILPTSTSHQENSWLRLSVSQMAIGVHGQGRVFRPYKVGLKGCSNVSARKSIHESNRI